jgi:hypothetical protein
MRCKNQQNQLPTYLPIKNGSFIDWRKCVKENLEVIHEIPRCDAILKAAILKAAILETPFWKTPFWKSSFPNSPSSVDGRRPVGERGHMGDSRLQRNRKGRKAGNEIKTADGVEMALGWRWDWVGRTVHKNRAVFHGVSRGSSKVLLCPAIPYHSTPCGWPTPYRLYGSPRDPVRLFIFTIL